MWSMSELASIVGANEESIYLMIGLWLSYPICIIFNTFFINKSKSVKLLYYLIFGLYLVYFNFGLYLIHSLVVCLFCYTILQLFSIRTAVIVNLTVPLIYLLYGCLYTQIGSNYSISWTLPQCVLTLRLIAITFDVFDGVRNQRILESKDKYNQQQMEALIVNKDTATESMPTLLEFLSHCYFPSTILVGPLISYRKYITYIESDVNHLGKCWKQCLDRLLLGLFYLLIYQIGLHYWPIDYLVSAEFSESGFWYRLTAIAIVAKVSMTKYLSSWLISEGSCIASGVAWDGKGYNSCANISVFKFETTPTFGGIIKSFNLTTNSFAAKYIFKRLKFLGNKTLSQALTLIFLAVWHGLSSGYFATFLMEFLIMKMETEVINRTNILRLKYKALNRVMNTYVVKGFIYLFFRIYTIYLLGYSFVPFMFLQSNLWYPIYSQTYFYGHLITLSWILISFFI